MNLHQAIVDIKFCKLQIHADNKRLTKINFANFDTTTTDISSTLIKETYNQIITYLEEPNFKFDLPLAPASTSFQQGVRKALLEIKSGETSSYKDLAVKLQTSPRAIGNACRTNLFPIIIPCHRVVSVNGSGGFSGETSGKMVDLKMRLLQHESESLKAKS